MISSSKKEISCKVISFEVNESNVVAERIMPIKVNLSLVYIGSEEKQGY